MPKPAPPSAPAALPILIDIPTACQRGGFSRTGCYKLMRAGLLAAVKVGGRTMIPASEIESLPSRLPRFGRERA
jgi:hypothetical protein